MSYRSTCEQCEELLLALDLTSERREAIRRVFAHLDTCEHCRLAAEEVDELRQLLRARGDDVAEPEGGWNGFEQRMEQQMQTLAGESPRNTGRGGGEQRRDASERMHSWRMAAALLIAIGLGLAAGVVGPRLLPRQRAVASDAEAARLSAGDLQQNVQAFDQIAGVFDRRASWVLLGDGRDSDMGLSSQPIAEDSSPLVLRLVLRRNHDIVLRSDLAIMPGEAAEASLATRDGRRVRVQIQTSKENQQQVALRLALGGASRGAGAPVHPLAESVMGATTRVGFGDAATVGRLVTTDGEYTLALGMDSAVRATAVRGQMGL